MSAGYSRFKGVGERPGPRRQSARGANLFQGLIKQVGKPDAGPAQLQPQRFDVVNLYAGLPDFIIEVKIGVRSLNSIRKDLEKIIKFISSVQLQQAKGMLGASVFQTHYRARQRDSVPRTTKVISVIEESIRKSLSRFARGYPKFEFDWVELQQPGAGIYGDEVYEDVLEGRTLGAFGHATRYHAVLLRRIA
jgi:hypothetical protein